MGKKSKNQKISRRQTNKVVLMVCEGKITEVTYFRLIKQTLKKSNIEIIKGNGSNPKNILEKAKEKYRDFPYDQIFCVFDKDSHHHYQSVIDEIESLNNNDMPIKAIYSAPCFEYWFLLHFKFTSSPFPRAGKKSTADVCTKALKKYIKNYDKKKLIIKEIFPQLYKKTNTAIKNAQKNRAACKKDKFNEPCTNVDELIEYLLDL